MTNSQTSRSGVEKFVDYLMKIYDDSIRTTNPNWVAGKRMFENKINYYEKNKNYSGFKRKLTDYQQKAQVTKHILGHAGIILAGRGFDSNFDIRHPQAKDSGPMGIGTFIGYLGSGAAELSDWLQRLIQKRKESISEINNDQTARKVADEFKKAFLKQISRDQLKHNLYNLLGE